MSAALARLPSTLEELLRGLGDACVVCGEQTEAEGHDGLHVSTCPSCGSVLGGRSTAGGGPTTGP